MKNNLLFTILGLSCLAFLFYDASGGVGAIQNADRTGSPLTSGNCASCHSGGNFNTSVAVELLDGDTPVATYQPEQNYTLRVTVNIQVENFAVGL